MIGSIGVRRDAKAIEPLSKLLQDTDAEVAQAAARSLGKIGTSAAAKAIDSALGGTPAANQLAFCEGLFRCAEALAVQGQRDEATAIYDRMRALPTAPQQVRGGALRGAILTRPQMQGLPLLLQSVRGDDWILTAAAARAAMEMPGTAVTEALAAELPKLSADKQVLVTKVLGKRGEAAAVPALLAAAKSGDKNARVAAIRALPEIGQASATPGLVELLKDADPEIAQAAQESLAALPGAEVDAAVLAMLNSGETDRRVTAIEIIARRRMTSALPALVKAASDADAKVRPAALRRMGELAGPGDLTTMLELLTNAKGAQDLDAAEQALSTVCAKGDEPDVYAEKLAALMPKLQPAQKSTVLRVLSAIGGATALKTVCAGVDDPAREVHAAAIRALGSWKSADAAPALIELAQKAANPTERQLCLRSFLGLASQAEVPVPQRLAMCKQAAGLLQNAQEKKMLLGTLGNVQNLQALGIISPYLDDAEVRDEAATAVLGIADKLLQPRTAAANGPRLVAPLQKVAQSANADLASRAKALLEKAQSKGARN